MNKLIWRMYNENRISLEVAEELLDCYYNRTQKVYQMKEEYRWILSDRQRLWLEAKTHILRGDWNALATNVLNRGKYSNHERTQLNELGRLVRTKKNTIDNIII